jgi:predicted lactoylglutathione lyase
MIGYITLGTNDLQRAGEFYDALLAELGAKRTMTDERMLAWGTAPNKTMLAVITPFNEEEATVGNGVMIALNVEKPKAVEQVYAKALSLGANDEGHPHDRGSSMGFYGGYFRDLDGNKLVAYCLGLPGDGDSIVT